MSAKILLNRFLVLIVLIGGTLLVACSAQPTVTATFFKRAETYTTAADYPDLMAQLNTADLTPDQAVNFVTDWATKKYVIGTQAASGYEQKNRLNIPYQSVGVLHVSGHMLVLPPRTYTNVPEGDDELLVKPALCVAPGKIAWRYNVQGARELKVAQEECYIEPLDAGRLDRGRSTNNHARSTCLAL